MSELLLLEFEGFGADVYERVNDLLGIDMDSGEGDWPAGLHTHLAGPTEGGGWIVVEVWESQEDQDEFMKNAPRSCPGQGGGHRPAEAGGVDQAQGTSHAQERFCQGQSKRPRRTHRGRSCRVGSATRRPDATLTHCVARSRPRQPSQ